MKREGVECPEERALHAIAVNCVEHLVELGLPESVVLRARDVVSGYLHNYRQRKNAGEFNVQGDASDK